MGAYVNPGDGSFAEILQNEYVDKTGVITLFDATLNSARKLVMSSRPRRFGKSYAAKMLVAFYSCGADSRPLFEGLGVSSSPGWDRHLNQFNVVHLEMTGIVEAAGGGSVVRELADSLLAELRDLVPDAGSAYRGAGSPLKPALRDVAEATGRKFVFVIDEWDAPYRLAQDDKALQDAYAEWLRGLFKDGTFTPHVVAGAYLTGILPIKKYAHQSAVSDFWEYTMVRPDAYAPFVGFTEAEVERLCAECGLDLADARYWYDGYGFPEEAHVYAPFSVMRACTAGKTGSYWVSTEAYESLRPYIEMDFDGLQEDIVQAIGGADIAVDPDGFQNDMTTILSKDDALALLIHLGYLAYDEEARTARVPNEEVRLELVRSAKRSRHPRLMGIMRASAQLVDDVVSGREEAVAARFQAVHDEESHPLFYNSEQALRAVVKSALVAAVDDYARIEELPGGKGFADIAYLPRRGSELPALVVELKWDEPVEAAIDQIHERGYPAVLQGLGVPVVLVGVTYSPKTKEHRCRIEVLD